MTTASRPCLHYPGTLYIAHLSLFPALPSLSLTPLLSLKRSQGRADLLIIKKRVYMSAAVLCPTLHSLLSPPLSFLPRVGEGAFDCSPSPCRLAHAKPSPRMVTMHGSGPYSPCLDCLLGALILSAVLDASCYITVFLWQGFKGIVAAVSCEWPMALWGT